MHAHYSLYRQCCLCFFTCSLTGPDSHTTYFKFNSQHCQPPVVPRCPPDAKSAVAEEVPTYAAQCFEEARRLRDEGVHLPQSCLRALERLNCAQTVDHTQVTNGIGQKVNCDPFVAGIVAVLKLGATRWQMWVVCRLLSFGIRGW
ncbi:unnamed protein product [Durusdinium trenchii]|uniref:Uncharacterized protein n=1 Tax=Durusdinium trenchii TaxID=1381693 RepID=A0ABP0HE04_9DINO